MVLATVLYGFFTAVFLGLFIWSLLLFKQSARVSFFFLHFLLLGYVYDNALVVFGNAIGAGSGLKTLYWIKLGWEYIFIGSIVYHSGYMARRVRVWSSKRVRFILFALSTTILGVGVVSFWYDMKNLSQVDYVGTVRYVPQGDDYIPLVSALPGILCSFSTLVLAALVWKQMSCFWLFVGTATSILGSIVPDQLEGTDRLEARFYSDPCCNMLLILGVLITEQKVQREEWVCYVRAKLDSKDVIASFMSDDLTYESD